MRTLIIEDHPAMIEGYKSILNLLEEITPIFYKAHNCQEAIELISSQSFDIIILDINIPAFKDSAYQSGLDIAEYIREKLPNSKLIIITSHIEKIILYSIAKDILPNALLVKSDFTPIEFLNSFKRILKGEIVFTQTVIDSIQELNKERLYLDAINRKILQLLDKGIMTKNLPLHLNLSQSAIDKRKAQIKEFLGVLRGSDEHMLLEARRIGLI